MKFTVLGCGRWGTFLACYLHKQGHEVLLWGRESSAKLNTLIKSRANDYLTLPRNITLSSSLYEALNFSDYILVAIYGSELAQFLKQLTAVNDSPKNYVLCMKELDYSTGSLLTDVVKQSVNPLSKVAICVGPVQPKEFVKNGEHACMIVDSDDTQLKTYLANCLTGAEIVFFVGEDLIGNQIGAAAKNIIGIGGGILEGLRSTTLKGNLMVMGTYEIANLIRAMGGKMQTAYGLCCLGDYSATLFSANSNSINYGKSLVTGESMGLYTPGARSAQALMLVKNKYGVDMPVCEMISYIISGKEPPNKLISVLQQKGF